MIDSAVLGPFRTSLDKSVPGLSFSVLVTAFSEPSALSLVSFECLGSSGGSCFFFFLSLTPVVPDWMVNCAEPK